MLFGVCVVLFESLNFKFCFMFEFVVLCVCFGVGAFEFVDFVLFRFDFALKVVLCGC